MRAVEFSFLRGRAVLDVTYFKADLTNEIGTGNFSGVYIPFNLIGDSTREGIEVSARVLVTDELSIGGYYTYLEAFQPDGQVEVSRPEHSGRVDVNYAFDKGRGNLNLAAVYNGEMEDTASLHSAPGVAAYAGVRFTYEELATKSWSEGR